MEAEDKSSTYVRNDSDVIIRWLERTHLKTQEILDSLPGLRLIFNPKLEVLYASHDVSSVLRIPREDILRQHLSSVFPNEDVQYIARSLSYINSTEFTHFETSITNDEGTHLYHCTLVRLKEDPLDYEGQLFSIIGEDITALKEEEKKHIATIEEHNRTLELKIEQRTAELSRKTKDIQSILDNLEQGIFYIDCEDMIIREYSKYLHELFELDSIENQTVDTLLLAHAELSDYEKSNIHSILRLAIGQDMINFESNCHLLAKKLDYLTNSGQRKNLELDWIPITDDHGIIRKLLVSIRDVTKLKELEAYRKESQRRQKILHQIINLSSKQVNDFFFQSEECLNHCQAWIQAAEETLTDELALIKGRIHTLKGVASTIGLIQFAEKIHEFEDQLNRTPIDRDSIGCQLTQMQKALSYYRSLEEQLEQRYEPQGCGGLSDFSEMGPLIKQFDHSVVDQQDPELARQWHSLRAKLLSNGFPGLVDILDPVIQSVGQIAHQLDKPTPTVTINAADFQFTTDACRLLRDCFIHLVRNALDHGLEGKDERAAKRKRPEGLIVINGKWVGDKAVITIQDDGRGLDLVKIREALGYKANTVISQDKLEEFIFTSGNSTKTEVTNISGRGVGMEAVKQNLNSFGGDINLEILDNVTPDIQALSFRFVLTIPGHHVIGSQLPSSA